MPAYPAGAWLWTCWRELTIRPQRQFQRGHRPHASGLRPMQCITYKQSEPSTTPKPITHSHIPYFSLPTLAHRFIALRNGEASHYPTYAIRYARTTTCIQPVIDDQATCAGGTGMARRVRRQVVPPNARIRHQSTAADASRPLAYHYESPKHPQLVRLSPRCMRL